jgi:hypothetical protein
LPYRSEKGSSIESPIGFRSGGKRREIFGTDTLLTKHALVFSGDGTELGVEGHLLSSGKPADFSAVLLHYLFNNTLFYNTEYAVRSECYRDRSRDYKQYHAVLADLDVLKLKDESSREFLDTQALLDSGYLNASERFKNFALAQEIPQTAGREVSRSELGL